jgi:hypothetical protein
MICVRYNTLAMIVSPGNPSRRTGTAALLPVALALLATLALAVPAGAALTPRAGGGAGNLHMIASGPVTVDVQGKLVAWGLLPAPGRIEIRGKAGTFTVRLGGVVQRPNRRGVVRLVDASGPFSVQGPTGVRIRIGAEDVDMSVAGRGSALLSGTGTYSLNGAPYVAWTAQPITIGPPPRVKPPRPPAPGTSGERRPAPGGSG